METILLFTINNKYIFVLDLLNICILYNIRIWFKLGLRPFHNSVGVLETDLEGIKFNKYVAVSKANLQNDIGRDE